MLCARRGLSWMQKLEDVVAELAERRGGRAAGQAGADDDDRELAAVRRVHQLHLELVPVPLLGQRARRDPGVELPGAGRGDRGAPLMIGPR